MPASRLSTFCAEKEHEFWPDAVSLLDGTRFRWQHIQGHRQITDVYLLALAVSNRRRLTTFDATISVRAVEDETRKPCTCRSLTRTKVARSSGSGGFP